ncbi:MAG: hypothetical protein H7Y39_04285 [Nitrospiraceae bacterium]|nr:hypothetical protein [Nitrospiraceae bacterium]
MESNGRPDNPPLPTQQTGEGICMRCGGLMMREYYLDLEDDTGQIGITGLRCTSCGDVIDSVILRNRLNPMPDLLHGVKQRKYAQRIDHGEGEC